MRLSRLYRIFRIFKLLKLSKNLKHHEWIEKLLFVLIMNSGAIRMIKTVITLLFFVHFFGSGWFLLARYNNFGPHCWVVRYNLRDASAYDQYVASVYW